MKHFALLPEAANGLRKALLNRLLFLAVIVVTVVFIVPMALSGETSINLSSVITLVLLSFILAIAYKLGLTRMKRMLLTYKLTITEDSVTREIKDTPTLSIPVNEIQKISRNADGSYTIEGKSALNAIGIPPLVERRAELELLLASIRPMTVKANTTIWLGYEYLVILIVLGGLFGTYMVENRSLATTLGVAFLGVTAYSWFVQQRSKNVSNRMRLLSYLMIIPVIAVIERIIKLWTE
jgi:hypothetical protein